MISKTATSLYALAACAALAAAAPSALAQVAAPAPSYNIPPPPAVAAPAPPPPAIAAPAPGPMAAAPAPAPMASMSYAPAPMTYAPVAPNPITNPQPMGDEGNWRAIQANNRWSERYDHLLEVNPRFRAYRMHKECSPIGLPNLQSDCLASFQQYEPAMYGSSTAPYAYGNAAGE